VGAAAQKSLRRIRRNAAKEREKNLNELKARLASRLSSKTTDTDAAIKNLERQLNDGRRFRCIARAIKPQEASATLTKKVKIVTTTSHLHPGTGQVVTNKTVKLVDTMKALEDAIIQKNRRHFAQAAKRHAIYRRTSLPDR
jgi:prephenate dehydratase